MTGRSAKDESEVDRTYVYVASIPGLTQWSDDYELLAEWAGDEERVELWDFTSPTACNGCGREVTLMGNGYCGHCQDRAPEIRTDGGQPEAATDRISTVDTEHEPEYVGAHSAVDAETCENYLDETKSDVKQCGADATHTVVMFSGRLHEIAMCDDCGEPGDVTATNRRWSA